MADGPIELLTDIRDTLKAMLDRQTGLPGGRGFGVPFAAVPQPFPQQSMNPAVRQLHSDKAFPFGAESAAKEHGPGYAFLRGMVGMGIGGDWLKRQTSPPDMGPAYPFKQPWSPPAPQLAVGGWQQQAALPAPAAPQVPQGSVGTPPSPFVPQSSAKWEQTLRQQLGALAEHKGVPLGQKLDPPPAPVIGTGPAGMSPPVPGVSNSAGLKGAQSEVSAVTAKMGELIDTMRELTQAIKDSRDSKRDGEDAPRESRTELNAPGATDWKGGDPTHLDAPDPVHHWSRQQNPYPIG